MTATADAPRAEVLSRTSERSKPPRRPPTIALVIASLTILSALILLFPVIAAPVHGDDRYWYLMIGHEAGGSLLNILQWSWDSLGSEIEQGRVSTLGKIERRIIGMATIELSVATATPIVVFQAIVKLLLIAGGVAAILAFVKSLRWRSGDGSLVRASRRTIVLVGVALIVGIGVGAQAHSQFRNGWTTYAVLTYGAAIAIFGSIALLLWLTRLVVQRRQAMLPVAIAALVLLGAATNISYELAYPAVPVAALALILVPVAERSQRRAELRAKAITGSVYLGSFLVIFAVIRWYIADLCSRTECYEGVTPQLDFGALRTMLYNFLTAIPGAGGNELRADLRRVGWGELYPVGATIWSAAVGLMVALALILAWRATRHLNDQSLGLRGQSDRRQEAILLAVGSGLALLVALGTAAIMGISAQAQEIITQPGIPYRNTMVTWTSLVLSAILAIRSLSLAFPRRVGVKAWAAMAVVFAIMATLLLPGNLMALRSYRAASGLIVTEAINWEVVLGDTSEAGEDRRCDHFVQLADHMSGEWTRNAIYGHANRAFMHYHDQPFCSDSQYPGTSE